MRIWIICSDSKFGLGFFPLFWLARDFWSCYKTANTTPRSSKEQTIDGGGGGAKTPKGETPEQGRCVPWRSLQFQLKHRLFKTE